MTDTQLWEKYKAGDQMALRELQNQYKPLVLSQLRTYNKAVIPSSALQAQAYKFIKKALDTYKPGLGPLASHIKSHMKKMYRYVNDNQNLVRLPENYKLDVNKFNTTQTALQEELDRAPSVNEMATSLGWKPAKVSTINTTINNTRYYSDSDNQDRVTVGQKQSLDVASEYALSMLSSGDRLIAKAIIAGESPSVIATRYLVSQSKVSRLKSQLVGLMKTSYGQNYRRF